jgi:AAA family ATP:ADP antiporter
MQAKNSNNDIVVDCEAKYVALRTLGIRATFLFLNFFLIILAYYQVKPASKSIYMEVFGYQRLPYVWIVTIMTIGVFVAFYQGLVRRYSRIHVVQGTCLVFSGLLIIFHIMLIRPGPIVTFCFSIFVDIFGLVLVEQFWSLTNSIYTIREGKSWYGIVGIGGLVGGVVGGALTAILIEYIGLKTPDLLLTAAGILGLLFVLTWIMGRIGIYCEVEHLVPLEPQSGGWRIMGHSRYLVLIAAILLVAQLAAPFIEYQFMSRVQLAYPVLDPRTAFLGKFMGLLGVVAIIVNLMITPLVLRVFGTIGGLLVQPLMISICSWFFLQHATLFSGGVTKISDRGLSYSINRAAKELLYVPLSPILIYQAKAWIDMFGYRLAKGAGSVVILLFTSWLPFTLSAPQLSWCIMSICAIWVAIIFILRQEHDLVCQRAG